MNFFKILGGGMKSVAIAKVNEESGRIHDDIDSVNRKLKQDIAEARTRHMNDIDALIAEVRKAIDRGTDKSHIAVNKGTSRIIKKIDRI